jgi:hypothetical protein
MKFRIQAVLAADDGAERMKEGSDGVRKAGPRHGNTRSRKGSYRCLLHLRRRSPSQNVGCRV